MYYSKKGQASIEFVIFIAIMIFTVIIFFGVMFQHTLRFNTQRAIGLVEDLGIMIQYEFDLAKVVKDGYVREFKIPQKLDGLDFNLSIEKNDITVISQNSISVITLSNVTINNPLQKGINTITKKNGIVYLN